MRVYVIRHGQSETNLKKQWTGWLDVNLTDSGFEDAKKAGKLLKDISFDKIYTSDLKRAIQTATTAIPDCEYQTTPLLREINVGTLAGRPLSVLTDEQKAQATNEGYCEFDGEKREDFLKRIRQVMNQLETLDCKNVALFCHAGWLCSMLDTVLGMNVPRKNVYCGNCAVAVFEFNNGIWRLYSWINF